MELLKVILVPKSSFTVCVAISITKILFCFHSLFLAGNSDLHAVGYEIVWFSFNVGMFFLIFLCWLTFSFRLIT